MSMEQKAPRRGRRQRAGVFDVRTIIGLLLGIYGVILTITGLVGTTEQDLAKTGNVNLSLWTGIALVVASAVFFVWARLRPVLVPADNPGEEGADTRPPAH
jgi:drug/metabolite transporter (DMT)-like permease